MFAPFLYFILAMAYAILRYKNFNARFYTDENYILVYIILSAFTNS